MKRQVVAVRVPQDLDDLHDLKGQRILAAIIISINRRDGGGTYALKMAPIFLTDS